MRFRTTLLRSGQTAVGIAAPGARQAFEALSYSGKQALVLPIEQAKTPETRQRRIDKALAALAPG